MVGCVEAREVGELEWWWWMFSNGEIELLSVAEFSKFKMVVLSFTFLI